MNANCNQPREATPSLISCTSHLYTSRILREVRRRLRNGESVDCLSSFGDNGYERVLRVNPTEDGLAVLVETFSGRFLGVLPTHFRDMHSDEVCASREPRS